MYNLAPLDIHIKEVGLTSYIRLRHQLDKPWVSKLTFAKPHLSCWEDKMKEALIEPADNRCQTTSWLKQYHVILTSFSTNKSSIKPSEYNIYTDGSKTDNGVGAGFVVYHKRDRIHTASISLPDTTTVFQAEDGIRDHA